MRFRVSELPLALGAAVLFFGITTATSVARWRNFEYRTFDLAYYTQALWQLLHGRLWSSILGVPLMGNHVEPIVLLLAPAFALVPHPMTLVVLQNAALAAMAPMGFRLARLIGNNSQTALLLAIALLLAPAAGYTALHEFHPEAFCAPLILAMVASFRANARRSYWAAILALLACKENMSALVAAFCIVELLRSRRAAPREPWRWFFGPLLVAIGWFVVCTAVISPALNKGIVDYASLYSRPGSAFIQAVTHGNLIWGLLLPFLGLPLLRPHWLLIASPLFLQHLLSWRSSEWTIYFHYAAPLLPLLWIATAETLAITKPSARAMAGAIGILAACCIAQALLGPAGGIAETAMDWKRSADLRAEKQSFVRSIPADASVVAPLPYLSHLALRENVYSLHFILKGLNTLGRSTYTPPPPTAYVLVDYSDDATFDAVAGYFHPQMGTTDRRLIASSERLLHEFLVRAYWHVQSSDALTLFEKTSEPLSGRTLETAGTKIADGNELLQAQLIVQPPTIVTSWRFSADRQIFPWMCVALLDQTGNRCVIDVGLCGIEVADGVHEERSLLTRRSVPRGIWTAELLFFDQSKRAWAQAHSPSAKMQPLVPPVPVGRLRID